MLRDTITDKGKYDYKRALKKRHNDNDNRAFITALSMGGCPLVARSKHNSSKCIIYESHLFSNCSHLWLLSVQMLLNSIKVLVTHMDTACGSQCCLFKMHKSAFVVNIRGCLGKNPIQVWDEQITLLSNRVVRASWKSRPAPSQQSQNSNHFPLLLSVGRDKRSKVVSKKERL